MCFCNIYLENQSAFLKPLMWYDMWYFSGLGLILQLGSDYEKKKHKLLQELQLDYKDGAAKVS